MPKSAFPENHRFLLTLTLLLAMALGLLILRLENETSFLWVNNHLTASFGRIAVFFSWLGESSAMGILLVISFFYRFKTSITIAFVWFSGACYSWLFKLWLLKGLPRPFEFYSQKGILIQVVEGVKVHHFNTFPSGHTLTAFSAAFLVLYMYPKTTRPLQMLLVLLAATCGLSRVVLAQHWPLDVLGGMLLGTLAFYTGTSLVSALPPTPFLDKVPLKFSKNNKR